MPYAQNNEVRIHYEVIGDGPPLVVQHGLGGRIDRWKNTGYVEPLAEKYMLILIDARGHGLSDKPHAPEKYNMEYMVGDITAVLDELKINRAHFLGYSMGGAIGLAIGKYAPERFISLIIGGIGLSERDSEERIEELQGYIRIFERGPDSVIQLIEDGRGVKLEEWEREKWQSEDLDALIAYCSNYENIGIVDFLPKVSIPSLLYSGDEDPVYPSAKRCAEIMLDAEFVSLPGLNHFGAIEESSLVLPHIIRFLERVPKI